MNPLRPYQDYLFSITRIIFGLLFAQHGAQKLFGLLAGREQPLFSLMGAAGVIEFAGGLLIALGLFTSVTALVASGEMAVAYFRSHAPSGFWPIENRGELAALYCFFFLYLAARGPGAWSLDRLWQRRLSRRTSRA